ncbi:MAG: hypothetical protein ACO3MG_11780, partial [Saprospiraceae bacterium]
KQVSPLSFILNQFKGASQAPTTAQVPGNNMMQASMPMNNLTEFGQMLANRVRSENPGISNQDLFNRLKRMSDAGFDVSNPVFKNNMLATGMANGGIATLNY